jgi:hypothetical protein
MDIASTGSEHDPVSVALLLPDGVGSRNFLTGPFLAEAKGRLSIAVLSAIPEHMRGIYEDDAVGPLVWAPYEEYRDTPGLFVLRNILTYAHMYSIDTFGMRCVRELPRQGNSSRRIATEATRWIGRGAAKLHALRWLDRRLAALVQKLPETARYRAAFERLRPAVVLSSNQRPHGVLPAVLAARSLGIPTATCIFSWDNLTSKGRIAAPFDHYLVWGALMKRELQQFYPEISDDRIHVVGAVQFDPHADPSMLKSRGDFFRELGADPARPLICYSSGDPHVSPEDQDHVALLLDMIRQGRISGNPQVVLRTTPSVDGRRFEAVRQRYPELIYSKPEWVSATVADWARAIPLPSDAALLTNLAHHSDMNVSVASTMTLDFVSHDTPVVNIAFDIADPPYFKHSLWDYYYRFEHYRPVVETGAALFSRSADDLVNHVNMYLANPKLHQENRRRLLEAEFDVPIGEASRLLVDTLRQIGQVRQTTSAVADTRRRRPAAPVMAARDVR